MSNSQKAEGFLTDRIGHGHTPAVPHSCSNSGGRPRVPPHLRLRDRYLALWLRFKMPDSSFGEIERLLSNRTFIRREGNSHGFQQPQSVARAARGQGMLPVDLIENARLKLPWFEPVYLSPLWAALGKRGTQSSGEPRFSQAWLSTTGLDSQRFANFWTAEGELRRTSRWLIQRAGRTTSLDALGLLVLCGRREHWFLRASYAGTYAVDVFRRLLTQSTEESDAAPRHPFEVLAAEIDSLIHKQLPRWSLLEAAAQQLPMIRPRPAWDYAEQERRAKAARRAELRRRSRDVGTR
ncbi:hypothetical protein ACG04R_14845 [Roseateles sp. BYS78W]|uniref:Uncharacterized protein n=1 Tax=Pelomonas candidula TaxID=3299025 RepID=A0ABW7HDV6_9BURK